MKESLRDRIQNLVGFLKFLPGYRPVVSLLLLPVFFVLHGNNENFGIIPIGVLVNLLGRYLLITLFVCCLDLLLFKSPQKSFIFSFYLLVLFFFFGSLYDFLQDTFPGSRIYSYKVLLPSIAILTVIIFWLLHRSRRPLKKPGRYITLLLLCFISLETVLTAYYALTNKSSENTLAGSFRLQDHIAGNDSCRQYPDIYFIVFDGYTSSSMLKNEFNYSNQALDSMLIRNRFFISGASQSNYNYTAFSLTSTFNLDYLKKEVETNYILPKEVLQATHTMRDNNLVHFLNGRGYEFRNFGWFVMDHLPSREVSFFDFYYYELIDNQTMYSRIQSNIGWNFTIRNIFTGKFRVPESYTINKEAHLRRNQGNYEKLLKELASTSPQPRFVYTHLILPHEPFFLKSDGSMQSDSAVIYDRLDNMQAYVEQVKYANQLLRNIIELSAKDSKRDKVIIIEGDHGYRMWNNKNLQKEFANLNAYYFSDHDYTMLYDGISPVNTFRVVLNKYFCQELPLLKDSSFYLKKPGQ